MTAWKEFREAGIAKIVCLFESGGDCWWCRITPDQFGSLNNARFQYSKCSNPECYIIRRECQFSNSKVCHTWDFTKQSYTLIRKVKYRSSNEKTEGECRTINASADNRNSWRLTTSTRPPVNITFPAESFKLPDQYSQAGQTLFWKLQQNGLG